MGYKVLLKTIHGSRLYGLAHEDSDWDFYTVVEPVKKKKAKYATHRIDGALDGVVVDLGTFLGLATKGAPAALEAMFSQQAEIDEIAELRAGWKMGTDEVIDRYLRTIKSFALEDTFKHKRHALRLALNLQELMHTGRFNPTLDAMQIELVNELAKLPAKYVYNDAVALAWQ